MGELASDLLDMLKGTELPSGSYVQLMSCSLCGLCTIDCPEDLDCAALVRAGRALLMQEYEELQEHYQAYRVDLPDNYFYSLRQAEGTNYDEGLQNTGDNRSAGCCQKLFMPGCALSCFSEPLTNTVFDTLRQLGLADAMTLYCCGNPLNSAGYSNQFTDYTAWLGTLLATNDVQQIITACPNCHRSLSQTLKRDGLEIELIPLPLALADAGMRYDPATAPAGYSFDSISVHDSCPDRGVQAFAGAVRQLFSACRVVEMQHHGTEAICCGSGGLAGLISPDRALARCQRRYQEFLDTQAGCMVAYCAACSNSFLRVQQDKPTRHYLELLFGQGFDWQRVGDAMNKMQ
jgi:Fe-S oxidoreductase